MSFTILDSGSRAMLSTYFGGAAKPKSLGLMLYSALRLPAGPYQTGITKSHFTACSGGGYADKTLPMSGEYGAVFSTGDTLPDVTWPTPTTSFAFTGSMALPALGYMLYDSNGIAVFYEQFPTPYNPAKTVGPEILQLTILFTLGNKLSVASLNNAPPPEELTLSQRKDRLWGAGRKERLGLFNAAVNRRLQANPNSFRYEMEEIEREAQRVELREQRQRQAS